MAKVIPNFDTDIYSTGEEKTGKKWIDGKPIYRKVIKHTYPQGSTTDSFSSGLSNLDFVKMDAYIYKYNGDWEKPYYSSSSDWCRIFYRQKLSGVENNTIEVRSSSNVAFDIYIVLEYTKTG